MTIKCSCSTEPIMSTGTNNSIALVDEYCIVIHGTGQIPFCGMSKSETPFYPYSSITRTRVEPTHITKNNRTVRGP